MMTAICKCKENNWQLFLNTYVDRMIRNDYFSDIQIKITIL